MLGEPLVVTVTVYTSTWFTEPPVFEEIQVKGALMVKLESRNSATSVTIGRKQYPAIRQKFVVYPNVLGQNTLPSFTVTTTCPPEGDYKGRERKVSTKERRFKVLPPPDGVDTANWLAAYNVTVRDSWNRPLTNLKAGDVLERRITINASGTLSATIPPLQLDSIDFGSIYVKTPILSNRQNRSSFSGTRVEIINYLLEKDGDFVIPELKVKWFKLSSKTSELAVIKEQPLTVAPNPDLEFILTRQKELQAELTATDDTTESETQTPFSLFGLNWWQLVLVMASIILLMKLLINLISKLKFNLAKKKKRALESEAHFFKKLIDSIENGTTKEMITALFHWYDRFRGSRFNPYLSDILKKSNATELTNRLKELSEAYYKNEDLTAVPQDSKKFQESIKHLRQKIKNLKDIESKQEWMQINPS
ncbi:hypothetical protein [Winogradskyella pelagia]|nr:hypothetical protein [Winogradskyella sp. DF17]